MSRRAKTPGWTECGWPVLQRGRPDIPPKPCGRPTVDGIACAKHVAVRLAEAERESSRAAHQHPASSKGTVG